MLHRMLPLARLIASTQPALQSAKRPSKVAALCVAPACPARAGAQCGAGYFPWNLNTGGQVCMPCDASCGACYGFQEKDCSSCRNASDYLIVTRIADAADTGLPNDLILGTCNPVSERLSARARPMQDWALFVHGSAADGSRVLRLAVGACTWVVYWYGAAAAGAIEGVAGLHLSARPPAACPTVRSACTDQPPGAAPRVLAPRRQLPQRVVRRGPVEEGMLAQELHRHLRALLGREPGDVPQLQAGALLRQCLLHDVR